MPYVFRPPTFEKVIDKNDELWRFYNHQQGYSVLVTGSAVTAYPGRDGFDTDQINAADYHYGGGRENVISDAEYATLVAADARWADHCEAL